MDFVLFSLALNILVDGPDPTINVTRATDCLIPTRPALSEYTQSHFFRLDNGGANSPREDDLTMGLREQRSLNWRYAAT